MRTAILIVIGLFFCGSLFAEDQPDAKDSVAIQHCIKTKTGANWNWEHCIGIISEICAKDETAMAPSEVVACYAREQAVWDDILNESYRRLRGALDDKQIRKLHDMQRAWIASRDKNCAFIYDYFQGSMANPMMAACTSRATAMQALFLLGFANDVAERK